jgi:hypothetical protein
VETVRGQREHTRKCSGAHCNHQQQAQAKSAYGRGQNKRADAERSTDLPDKLLVKKLGSYPRKSNREEGRRSAAIYIWGINTPN